MAGLVFKMTRSEGETEEGGLTSGTSNHIRPCGHGSHSRVTGLGWGWAAAGFQLLQPPWRGKGRPRKDCLDWSQECTRNSKKIQRLPLSLAPSFTTSGRVVKTSRKTKVNLYYILKKLLNKHDDLSFCFILLNLT